MQTDRYRVSADVDEVFDRFVERANDAPRGSAVRASPPPLPPVRPPEPPGEDASAEREADRVVPDVARIAPRPDPAREASVDGQVPAGELDRLLSDMTVLLRYGHREQVRAGLDGLLKRYPEDLLLHRRIAEFHVETGDAGQAVQCLFVMATRLFERRNVTGMRRALEQVRVLEPDNPRAARLLGLLDQRRPDRS